ncbi:1830_t:CDS:1, partial [Funneliformis geosporum]
MLTTSRKYTSIPVLIKPTTLVHSMCNLHIDKYYSKIYYHRKKLNILEKSALYDPDDLIKF